MCVYSTQRRTRQGWYKFSALWKQRQEHALEGFTEEAFRSHFERPASYPSLFWEPVRNLHWTSLVILRIRYVLVKHEKQMIGQLVLTKRYVIFQAGLNYSLGIISNKI